VEEVEASRFTTVDGVRIRSSRRMPGHCGRVSTRKDMAGMLLARRVSGGSHEIPSFYRAAAPSRRDNQLRADYHTQNAAIVMRGRWPRGIDTNYVLWREPYKKCLNEPLNNIGRIFTVRLQIQHLNDFRVRKYDNSLPLDPRSPPGCDSTFRWCPSGKRVKLDPRTPGWPRACGH
jgi:hypothetical protein